MKSPTGPTLGTRARDADRQRVIDSLSEAHGSGQLTFDEFEERSRVASSARTLQDLMPLTTDLQGAPVITVPDAPVASSHPSTWVIDLSRQGRVSREAPSPGRRLVRGTIGLAVLTGGCVGIMLFVHAVAEQSSALFSGGDSVEMHSAQGYADFVKELEQTFGTTEVVGAVVYPGYAVVQMPVEGEPEHVDSFYYDGSFDEPTSHSTREADDPLLDLAAIDGGVLGQLVEQAPEALGVTDPESGYVIIGPWGEPAQVGLSVYASGPYGSGYLVAATDGHLLDAVPPS